MKTWRKHTFVRRLSRSFSFSVHADRCCAWLDITIGRHNWSLEVEW